MTRQPLVRALPVALVLAGTLLAQDLSLELLPGYSMRIEGTSNVRKWDADVERIDMDLRLDSFDGKSLADLRPEMFKTLRLSIPVEEITSGTPGLAGKIKKHLKKDEHPTIEFALKALDLVPRDSIVYLAASGLLQVAGKEKLIRLDGTASQDGTGIISFTGHSGVLMTDFGIDPPKAMLGTLRARDPVDIHFTLRLQP